MGTVADNQQYLPKREEMNLKGHRKSKYIELRLPREIPPWPKKMEDIMAKTMKANSSDWIALIAQILPLIIQMIMELLKSQQVTPAQAKKLRTAVKKLETLEEDIPSF